MARFVSCKWRCQGPPSPKAVATDPSAASRTVVSNICHRHAVSYSGIILCCTKFQLTAAINRDNVLCCCFQVFHCSHRPTVSLFPFGK
jgi:hypothetical protein